MAIEWVLYQAILDAIYLVTSIENFVSGGVQCGLIKKCIFLYLG